MKIDINNSDYLDGTYHLSLKTERSSKEISAKDMVHELDNKSYSFKGYQNQESEINGFFTVRYFHRSPPRALKQ